MLPEPGKMIVLDRLAKRFGALVAVDGISLSVSRGEVLGFLGPNGAGKSTTMKMIAGFLPSTSGTARVAGIDVAENPVAVKKRIGYLPEGAPTYGDMTPAGFFNFAAEVRGLTGAGRKAKIEAVADTVDISKVMNQPIETLSKGFKRRVGLAQAMLHDPEILILDEPTDGLDPNQKHHVRGLIRRMAEKKAIIISTHVLEEVDAVCNRAVIIAHGKILADGTPEELRARAHYHNATRLFLDAASVSPARKALGSLANVASVEDLDPAGGRACIRVSPKDGRPLAGNLAAVLAEKGIAFHELYVEQGRLDEVFYNMTHGETTEGGVKRKGGADA